MKICSERTFSLSFSLPYRILFISLASFPDSSVATCFGASRLVRTPVSIPSGSSRGTYLNWFWSLVFVSLLRYSSSCALSILTSAQGPFATNVYILFALITPTLRSWLDLWRVSSRKTIDDPSFGHLIDLKFNRSYLAMPGFPAPRARCGYRVNGST